MKESNRHSIRQLKKRVLKELSSLSLSDLSSSKSMIEPEEIICVDSKQSSLSFKSTLSSKTNKSDTIDIEGCEEQLDRLKEFIRENPKSLTCARLFCMGRELKSNASLKQMRLPCFPDTPIPIQFVLKEDPLPSGKRTKGDTCYLCMNNTMFNCCIY
ncbi:hypothetical protein WA171_005430 [Blastocystis sp. BT1]